MERSTLLLTFIGGFKLCKVAVKICLVDGVPQRPSEILCILPQLKFPVHVAKNVPEALDVINFWKALPDCFLEALIPEV